VVGDPGDAAVGLAQVQIVVTSPPLLMNTKRLPSGDQLMPEL
jgi:hypothetical protein